MCAVKSLKIKNNTKLGYLEAHEGDGVYTNITNKRGTVQPQTIQTITTRRDLGVVEKGLKIRKLTPKECWRLMGFTDQEFEKAQAVNSNAQLYKQAGKFLRRILPQDREISIYFQDLPQSLPQQVQSRFCL